MPIEPVAFTVGAALIYLAGLGTREMVRWARGEIAFSRAVRGELDAFAARFHVETGQRLGLIEDVPPHLVNPSWIRDLPEPTQDPGEHQPAPDDDDRDPGGDDEYERAAAQMIHATVEAVRGDDDMAAWPINRQPGAHRLRGDDTQDLSGYADAFRYDVEVAAP